MGIEWCNKGIPWKILLRCSLLFARSKRYNIFFSTLREEEETCPFCFGPQESRLWAWPHFFPHSSHHCRAIGSRACLPFLSSFCFPFGFVSLPPLSTSQVSNASKRAAFSSLIPIVLSRTSKLTRQSLVSWVNAEGRTMFFNAPWRNLNTRVVFVSYQNMTQASSCIVSDEVLPHANGK